MTTYEVTEQKGQAGYSEEAIRTEIVEAESAREAILSVFDQPEGWVFEEHPAVTSLRDAEDGNRSGMYVHYYMAVPFEAEDSEDSE